MAKGRPVEAVVLSREEELVLAEWARRRRTAQGLALRARIVLGAAAGEPGVGIARRLGVSNQMVCKWRARFREQRMAGLLDEPRPGAPRRISDRQVEAVLARTLESMPQGATHWSTRSMARASGLSPAAVGRIWRAFDLLPKSAHG